MAVTGCFLDREWEYQEILLGFEPLSGTHSGVNLGDMILKILHPHQQITNRVIAVTTSNASNNNTMISSIQIQSNLLSSIITRTSFGFHDIFMLRISEGWMIVDALNKVRNPAVYINASPRRREAFCNLQPEGLKLVPIQDARTR
ncbi:hypothetical protein TSTA_067550 [Talaromyces stipitatus ATCC 10500]|uniref:Uncharacterized protein n=1 Tax=Talaromyces stipitatus (strain ATCC 10500 / CBS 375.48 / QM 6759 / NRRL 1006) TaxID=441959 RepID=B8LY75_TALSN|nr:uncharacterized protein TSTA_067550 [Talaromyces stipitatus ATCC 10500]EED23320.1 hypothetical protein TSTA_067550 [Talaromyces stipitatus ATCC 10500]